MALSNDVIIEIYDNDINQMDDACFNPSNVNQTRAQRIRKALKLKMKQFVSMMSKPKPLLITLCCFALLLVTVYIKTALYSKVNHEITKQSRALLSVGTIPSNNLAEWFENASKQIFKLSMRDLDQLWERGLVSIVGKNESDDTRKVYTYYVKDLMNGYESQVNPIIPMTALKWFVKRKLKSGRTDTKVEGKQNEWRKINLQEWIGNPGTSTSLMYLLKSGQISVIHQMGEEGAIIRDKRGQCALHEIKEPGSKHFMLLVSNEVVNGKIMRLAHGGLDEYVSVSSVDVQQANWQKPTLTPPGKNTFPLNEEQGNKMRQEIYREFQASMAGAEDAELRREFEQLQADTHGEFAHEGRWADDDDLDGDLPDKKDDDDCQHGADVDAVDASKKDAEMRVKLAKKKAAEIRAELARREAAEMRAELARMEADNSALLGDVDGNEKAKKHLDDQDDGLPGDEDGEKAKKEPSPARWADDEDLDCDLRGGEVDGLEETETAQVGAAASLGAPTGTHNPPLPGGHQQILTGNGWERRSQPGIPVPDTMMYGQDGKKKLMKVEERKGAIQNLKWMVHKEAEGVLNEKEFGWLHEFLMELTTHGEPVAKKKELERIFNQMVFPDLDLWTQNGKWWVPRFTKRIVMYWFVERVIEDYKEFSNLDERYLQTMRQTYQRMRIRLERLQEGQKLQ